MTRRKSLVLLAGLATGSRATAAAPTAGRHRFEQALMGTRFAITCHHPNLETAREAAAAAFQAAAAINAVASDYIADSELLSLSKQPADNPALISPLLFGLLSQAREIAEATGGHFDPTLGPLTKLWRECRRRKKLPEPDALAEARNACGWRHLVLNRDERTVRFAKRGMRLDLGGIAKGQAADAMLAILIARGIPRSCITAGGDVRAGDSPPDSDGWKIAVRSSPGENATPEISLSNNAVSTSGDLHQSVVIGKTRYSHIIDPATGLGLTRPAAATVIADRAAHSDALATAACTAPPDLALAEASAWGATRLLLHHHR